MMSLVLAIVVLAAVVAFSVQNASPVGVSLFLWRFDASLAMVIFLSVLAGITIGLLFSAAYSFKRAQHRRRQAFRHAPASTSPAPPEEPKV